MKRSLCIFIALLTLYPLSVFADDALGALFTTPHQRVLLDRLSLNPGEETVVDESSPVAVASDEPVKKVKVGGLVVNSKGQSTTWLNHDDGASVTNSDKTVKATAGSAGKVDVLIQREGKQISLKPGQEFNADTGKVSDPYQNTTASEPKSGNNNCRASKAIDGEVRVVCGPAK